MRNELSDRGSNATVVDSPFQRLTVEAARLVAELEEPRTFLSSGGRQGALTARPHPNKSSASTIEGTASSSSHWLHGHVRWKRRVGVLCGGENEEHLGRRKGIGGPVFGQLAAGANATTGRQAPVTTARTRRGHLVGWRVADRHVQGQFCHGPDHVLLNVV